MRRLLLVLVALAGLASCGSPPKAYLPIDSPLKPWQAPEPAAQQETEPQGEQAAPPSETAPAQPG